MSSPDQTICLFAVILPCIALIGVWAIAEGTRLARGVRSGEY